MWKEFDSLDVDELEVGVASQPPGRSIFVPTYKMLLRRQEKIRLR